MKRIPEPGKCEEIKQTSPSTAVTLSECMYKAGQKRTSTYKKYSEMSPSVLIGIIVHNVIERAFSEDFSYKNGIIDPLTSAEKMWEEEVDKVCNENLQKNLGPPETWPYYGMKRARTIYKAKSILENEDKTKYSIFNKNESFFLLERCIEDPSGKIIGRPDAVYKDGPNLIVEDFKSGGIRDESGAVIEKYEKQILIYCWLVKMEFNKWPDLAVITSIEDEPYREKPDYEKSKDIVQKILTLLSNYNEIVCNKSSNFPDKLASPSVDSCRWCGVKPWCTLYWRSTVPNDLSNEYRADIEGRLLEKWKFPEPMELWDGNKRFTLGVNPNKVESDKKLKSNTVVRCINAELNEDNKSYYADDNSELWYGESID